MYKYLIMNTDNQIKKMSSFTPQPLLLNHDLLPPLLSKKKEHNINYKNIFLLRKFISIEGKILPRRLTNLTAKKQRHLAKAIKNARIMGFLPFVRQVIY